MTIDNTKANLSYTKPDTTVIDLFEKEEKSLEKQLKEKYATVHSSTLIIRIVENMGWRLVINHDSQFTNQPNFNKYQLKRLPKGLNQLHQLVYLNISNLGLSELPDDIEDLKNLKELDISLNPISFEEISKAISKMNNLAYLNAYGCGLSQNEIDQFKNKFPSIIFRYTKDEYLDYTQKSFEPLSSASLEKRNKDLLQLYKSIYTYYPIGSPYFNEEYPGFNEIKEINEKKYQSELWTQWSSFKDSIKEKSIGLSSIDQSNSSNLSYSLLIPFTINQLTDVKDGVSIKVSLSIACKYYTIFFSRVIRPENTLDIPDKLKYNLFQSVLYGSINASKEELIAMEQVKALLSSFFPTYKHYSHHSLFTRKLKGGLPLGLDINVIQSEYSFYHYLFDSSFNLQDPKIMR